MHHQQKKFEQVTYEDQHVIDRNFTDCTFVQSALKGCVFEDCSFDRCTFIDCDLSLVKFKSTSFNGLQVIRSKAIGIRWDTVRNLRNVHFKDSLISYSSFAGKMLKKAAFIDCIADEVDFTDAVLQEANLSGTDLIHARFFNTDLTGADFSRAKNYHIDIRNNKVKNATFTLPEALQLLSSLEITIE